VYGRVYPDSGLGFRYDSHWNARGHRVVGGAIGEVVEKKGWLL
jgi:hypothetical protein